MGPLAPIAPVRVPRRLAVVPHRGSQVVGLALALLPWLARASEPAPSVTVLTRTLAYEEGLAARLTRDPLAVYSFGFDCVGWPAGARIAGRTTACRAAEDRALVQQAANGAGVILLGTVDRLLAVDLIARARGLLVPVLALGSEHASSDVLLAADGTRTFVGDEAVRFLGARFPASVLRLATIVTGAAMPPPLPEDADPPEPQAANEPPAYPEDARTRGLEGVVVLRVGVSTRGTVQAVQVVKGDEPFATAASTAARRWRYTPASLDGKPVATSLIVKVPFRLSGQSAFAN
ncbi:MAG: energy transducer TonB [Myxococcaceae bacterium]|nr:energy transducer TonB [Myxococcaceae bacterium]